MLSPSSFVALRDVRQTIVNRVILGREHDDALKVMRGLVNGLLISAVFWALILWLVL